jgi:molybdate transport system ATP-binding protein
MTARLTIELRAVSVRRGAEWVLRDISLCLRPGERWALIGGNGAGKTQLLKLLGTDVWPTPTGREARTYRLGSRSVDVIAAKERVAYLGAELQDKYSRYAWDLKVQDLLATGLHRTDLLTRPVTAEESRRVAAMLRRCGLARLKQRRFLSLSYGQKRLALLARALVRKPDWLLLDEIYNGLDAESRRRIDGLLERARDDGQSWIAAAHRDVDVPAGTRGCIELRAGRVHAITRPCRAARGADPFRLARQAEERPARPWLPSHGAASQATRGEAARGEAARGEATGVEATGVEATGVEAEPAEAASPAPRGRLLLRITAADLFVDYRPVLRDLHWELRDGEHWAVFGANGAGKSSFLKLLYGDLSPAHGGKIERSGFPRGAPIDAWKRQVGFVSPELQTDYARNVTVCDLVASGRYASIGLCTAPTAADVRHARHWLGFFALLSVAKRTPSELSYGQLRRALLARALAGEARILLLDEPLTGLDPRRRAAMKRLLERLMARRITLVMAVHHPEDLPRGMTHALHLHGQRALALDPPPSHAQGTAGAMPCR